MTPIQYSLTGLSTHDMQLVLSALGNLPHSQVHALFSNVAQQVDLQNREFTRASQAPVTPPAQPARRMAQQDPAELEKPPAKIEEAEQDQYLGDV